MSFSTPNLIKNSSTQSDLRYFRPKPTTKSPKKAQKQSYKSIEEMGRLLKNKEVI